MLWPDMDTGVRLRVTWLILGLVLMAMSSVLSWFIFNILSHIHSATSSMQSFKLWTRTGKSEGVLELWSCESSVKKACVIGSSQDRDQKVDPGLGGGDISAADLMIDTPRQARPEINRVVTVGWRPTN